MPIVNYFDANTTATINETYTYSHAGATPDFAWIVIAVAAFAFLALAFNSRMRDENGSINPSRIGFSLIGTIIGASAAWLSLTIDLAEGVGVSSVVIDNITVVHSISMHSIYEGGLLVVVFVLCSVLSFSNLIYSLTRPELLESDESEFSGKRNESRTKAEQKTRKGDEE